MEWQHFGLGRVWVIDHSYLRDGIGENLAGILASLKEATDEEGRPRFQEPVVRAIARDLVCRTYAKPAMLELAWFLVAAEWVGGAAGFARIFSYLPLVRGKICGRYFLRATLNGSGEKISAHPSQILIQNDGQNFEISYSRMPYLIGFLETLLAIVDYPTLSKAVKAIALEANGNPESLAKDLSRKVYEFLEKELPPLHTARKRRYLLDWLKHQEGFAAEQGLKDGNILLFWKQQTEIESNDDAHLEFRQWQSLVDFAFDLIRCYRVSRDKTAAEYSSSIGGNHEEGEVSPEIIHQMVTDLSLPREPLAVLADFPEIKFVNARERDFISGVTSAPDLIESHGLSILRRELFGPLQSRLTQAMRDRRDFAFVRSLIDHGPEIDATTLVKEAEAMAHQLDLMVKACLFLLFGAENDGALILAARLDPAIQDLFDQSPSIQLMREKFWSAVELPSKGWERISALHFQCRIAYQQFNRQGFKVKLAEGDPMAEVYADGAFALLELRARLGKFSQRMTRLLVNNYESAKDVAIFSEGFSALYLREKR